MNISSHEADLITELQFNIDQEAIPRAIARLSREAREVLREDYQAHIERLNFILELIAS